MEGSDKIARLRAAQENIDDVLEAWDSDDTNALSGAMADAAEQAREVQSEYEEALDAWEHGNEQLQEKVDQVEAWADELENAVTELENLSPDVDDEEDEEVIEGAMETFREEASGIVENARDALEL